MDLSVHSPDGNSRLRNVASDQNNVGWRLRTLRLRRDLTLVELAGTAGLDISYLSRLERDALQNAKPKPDTINRVLDALQATPQECEAVYHVERPSLSHEQIVAQVLDLAPLEEDSTPLLLRDDHWCVWYYNHSARATLGLTEEEYWKCINVHML